MPSVTYDGRSFMLDGRRIWIVSGSIPYSRIPAEHWADRIRLAKLAGLNTIETTVHWHRHNPRPAVFDFKGDQNIRHFIQLCGEAGLHVILRVGPFVGGDADMGGLPAWLIDLAGVKLRANSAAYLEACSRFITALADQIRDLQITAVGKGGPLLLIQNESGYTCGVQQSADSYLGELMRFYRESGIDLPILNANNLWQSVEGEIDAWVGSYEPVGMLRQLGTVRPDQPKMIIDFPVAAPRMFNAPSEPAPDPLAIQRRLAEVLAGGGQFNIVPFAAGNVPGFWGGRSPEGQDRFASSAGALGALVTDTGSLSPAFHPVRRILTFAARFSRVFSNLDPAYQPVVIDPARPIASGASSAKRSARSMKPAEMPVTSTCTVTHVTGPQGGCVFVFGDDPSATGTPPRNQSATLLLPDGSTLAVHLGKQAVAWVLMEVHLGGRARLNYCNLSALAIVGKVFVCYGPAGATGRIAINGAPVEFLVPTSKTPLTLEHENLLLVVLSEEQADHTYVTDSSIYIGVDGIAADGKPVHLPGVKNYTHITSDGAVKQAHAELVRVEDAPHLERGAISKWEVADCDDYTSGESARYATIAGPADLSAMGSPFGYGWYRVSLKGASAHRAHVVAPSGGDRLHAYLEGEPAGILGVGPGADDEVVLGLKKSPQHLVFLADNCGRFAGGNHLGERKGLFGHLFEHEVIKAGKPRVDREPSIEPLTFRTPIWDLREGDTTWHDRLSWTISHRKKGAVLMILDRMPARSLVVLNGAPIAVSDQAGPRYLVLTEEQLSRGNNIVQLALMPESGDPQAEFERLAEAAATQVRFSELGDALSAKADWAFAKWEPPAPSNYRPATAKQLGGRHSPTWWRSTFRPADTHTPLLAELTGMTKGQLYLNNAHIARYWHADPNGKAVPPQDRIHLPRTHLRPNEDNELVLFDEHGGHPTKISLVYEPTLAPMVAKKGK